jgi:hypothetical protein
VDGRASRGPRRAVGAAHQSTVKDLGAGGGGPAGFGASDARQFARPALVACCRSLASWRGAWQADLFRHTQI